MNQPIAAILPADKPRRLPWWRRWRGRLLWLVGTTAILLIGAWLFVSSAFFFRGIIIPALEKKLHARITAEQIDWSPLNGITLRGLSIQTTGDNPVFQAAELRLRARAWELTDGAVIQQLHLAGPLLHIAVAPDGTSNLDPIIKALQKGEGGKSPDLSKLSVANGTLRYTREDTTCAIKDIDLTLDRLADDVSGKLKITANASHQDGANKLAGQLNLQADLTVGTSPSFRGNADLTVQSAGGTLAEWVGANLQLTVDRKDNTLRQLRLTLNDVQGQATINASGTRDADTGEWLLSAQSQGIARRVLKQFNVALEGHLDPTSLNGTHTVRLQPSSLSATGSLHGKTPRPEVNWIANYKLDADLPKAEVLVKSIALSGQQSGRETFAGQLLEPLRLNRMGIGRAKFELKGNRLNLLAWREALGHKLEGGAIDFVLKTTVAANGETAEFSLDAKATHLRGAAARWFFNDEDMTVATKGRVAAGRVSVYNSSLRHLARLGGTRTAESRLEELSLTWLTPENGPANVQLTASLTHVDGKDRFSGHLSAGGLFKNNPAGLLSSADANASVVIDVAEGLFAEAQGLAATAQLDLSPGKLREARVDFRRGKEALGRITATGARAPNGPDWVLDATVSGVDRRVLNFLGASRGLDFGDTVANSTNRIRFTPGVAKFSVDGRATATAFRLTRASVATPQMNAVMDYLLKCDWPAQRVVLEKIELTGTQDTRHMLTGRLLKPLPLAWGAGLAAAGESRLEIKIAGADLAQWRPVLGGPVSSGVLDATVRITARNGARELGLQWESSAGDLSTPWFRGTSVAFRGAGTLANFKKLTLADSTVTWREPGVQEYSVGGAGTIEFTPRGELASSALEGWFKVGVIEKAGEYTAAYSRDTGSRQLKLKASRIPPPLLRQLFGKVRVLAGEGSIDGEITENAAGTKIVKARAEVSGLRLEQPGWPRSGADVQARFDGFVKTSPDGQHRIEWHQASGVMTSDGRTLGEANATGMVLLGPKEGQAKVALKQFKIKMDASLLQIAESVWPQASGVMGGRVEADLAVNWDSETGLRCRGLGEVTDWVARNGHGKLSRSNSASAVFDFSRRDLVITLHDCRVDLGKSKLADNQVALTGTYDFSQPGKIIGRIQAQSDAMELERMLRALAGEPSSELSGGRDLLVDLKIEARRLHWNGLTATNFTATASVTNKITEFSKIQMYLEGGPLGAYYRQDRSRRAWSHDVAIAARKVPLTPLLDLFVKDHQRRWVSLQKWGVLDADLRLRWAQVPGTDWDWRAAAMEGVKGPGSDAVLRLSDAAIAIPEGDRTEGLVPGVLRIVVNTISTAVKAPKLRQAKVESARLVGRIGENKLATRLSIHTPLYKAEIGGIAPVQKRLADTPLDSLPVEVSLAPELAREYRLGGRLLGIGKGKQLQLPVFLHLKGQLSDLRAETDPVVLGAIFTAGLGGKAINVPIDVLEKTSGIIDQLPVPINPLNIFFQRKK